MYWHMEDGVKVWTEEWVEPTNNPFTPEGWQNVIQNWADVGIDVSESPPIYTPDPEKPTYPFGDPLPGGGWSPGASADPAPLTEDPFPTTEPTPSTGEGGVGNSIAIIAGIAVIALIAGLIK